MSPDIQAVEESLIHSLLSRLSEEAHGGWELSCWRYDNTFVIDGVEYEMRLVPKRSNV
jgi:hypothetical protein